MKAIVERDPLASALSFVRERSRAGHIQILQHIRLTAEGKFLRLVGHDLDCSSEVEIPADIKTEGVCAVPSETTSKLIQSLPKGAHVEIEYSGRQVKISHGKSKYTVPTLPAEDFPPPLSVGDVKSIPVTAADLVQLFDRPRSALDPKDTRVFYQGIHLHVDDGLLCATASDGHRMLKVNSSIACGPLPNIIVPAFALDEICKFDDAEISWSDSLFCISGDGRRFVTKLIESNLIEYRKVLPKEDENYLEVDRTELKSAISRICILIDRNPIMRLEWGNGAGGLHLSLVGVGTGEGEEVVDCSANQLAPGKIATLPREMLKILDGLKGEVVQLHTKNASKPFRIFDPSDPTTVAVLVPCYAGAT